MKVLVTGSSGFTGSYVVSQLLKRGIKVRCFVRKSSDLSRLHGNDIEFAQGDLSDPSSLAKALQGMDALVNIASLGFGHAPGIVEAVQKAGIKRAVFISTTAIFTQLNAPSKKVRMAAEQTVRESGIDFTILRPTMIYGSPRDRNMCRLIRYLKRWPLIPVIGKGECLQQPVFVDDLAWAIAAAVQSPQTARKEYNISGKNSLSYNEVVDTVCRLLKCRVGKVHLPVSPVVGALGAFEKCGIFLPIKAEQILRLNEDKAFSHEEANRDFGYKPRTFAAGVEAEIKEMGLN